MNALEWLGLDPEKTTEEELNIQYKSLARVYHPDNPETGDHDRFVEMKSMVEMARKEILTRVCQSCFGAKTILVRAKGSFNMHRVKCPDC